MLEIVRVWKDTEYREALSVDELTMIPENPAGVMELTDEELSNVAGGIPRTVPIFCTFLCCTMFCTWLTIICNDAPIQSGMDIEERVMLADTIDHLIADGKVTQDEIDMVQSSLQETESTPEDMKMMESFRADFTARPELSDEQIKAMTEFSSFLRDDSNFE